MKRNRAHPNDNRSIKAVYIYGYIVLVIIIFSLIIKSYYIFKMNRYTEDNITIKVIMDNEDSYYFGIDRQREKLSMLKSQKINQPAILTDAEIRVFNDIPIKKPKTIFLQAIYNPSGLQTNLTIFDLVRLLITSQINTIKLIESVDNSDQNSAREIDKLALDYFSDSQIIDDGLTVQIINSTQINGLGQRIERLIVNKGATVISLINQGEKQEKSIILNTSHKEYTANKIGKLLNIPVNNKVNKSVADIVIILGEDAKSY